MATLSLTACGDDDEELNQGGGGNSEPPTELKLLSTTPANGATDVPLGDIEVVFTFNQNVHWKDGTFTMDSFVEGATIKEIALDKASLYITVNCTQSATRVTIKVPQGFLYSPKDMPSPDISLSFTTAVEVTPLPGNFETAAEAVKNMGVGWNMGNTLEANRQTITDVNNDGYWGQQGLESETCWGQYAATPELLKMMKDAGFGAIRVPVTWYNHMDKNGNVDAAWMQRVHQVVDYVISQDMYCIINVHHDTGADGDGFKSWLKADTTIYNTNKARYEYLWKQIAEEFQNYDQRLLFESYNEMLDKVNSWCFASFAADGQYNSGIATSAYKAINSYAQSFVNVVRATGGNNASRNLVVNTYGACNGSGTWNNNHLQEPLTKMALPTDVVSDHLIFQVHAYPGLKNNNLASIKNEVSAMMTTLKSQLAAKGAPVIVGEWGTMDWDSDVNYNDNRQNFLEFCTHFVQQAKNNDIGTFYWMGISDGASRLFPAFSQPDLARTILQAYHGTGFNPTLPVRSDYANTCIQVTVSYTNQWGEFNVFDGKTTASEYSGLMVELANAPAAGFLQLKVYCDKEDYLSVTNAVTTLNFLPSMGTITRITLQSNNPSGSTTIKGVWLLKKDGTKTPVDPSVFWGCTMSNVTLVDY